MLRVPIEPVEAADALAIQRMLDDGAPIPPRWRARRLRLESSLQPAPEPSAEARAAQRRAARRLFRLYCIACGRSTESSVAPLRVGRCPHCGGTMLVEMVVS